MTTDNPIHCIINSVKAMKKHLLIFVLSFLAACSGNKEKSDAYGTFEATEIMVSAEVPGKILQFNIEEGQVLSAGSTVGLIDTIDWQLKKEQLQAQKNAVEAKYPGVASQISVLEQQLKNLITEKNRIEKLFNEGAATRKQLDDINGNIEVVQKQIRSVETQNAAVAAELSSITKQIEQVNENLRRCRITNPVNGTVLQKYSEQGELTTAGKPLYKIADLSQLYLRAYVSGAQLPKIKLGNKVKVLVDKDEHQNTEMEGVVSWISPSAEFTPKIIQTKEERVNLVYAVKIRVNNDGTLKIGMPGEVVF